MLIYRSAFSDLHNLSLAAQGIVPDLQDVLRRIFVLERQSDVRRPDHFYHAYRDQRLGSLDSWRQLIRCSLKEMGSRHIHWVRGKPAIKPMEFEHWQHCLPFISPLAVIIYWLRENVPGGAPTRMDDRLDLLRTAIPYSALISPALPGPEDMIQREGLNEMHMHLNGSTESDWIWVDTMENLTRVADNLRAAPSDGTEKILELYAQIEAGLTPAQVGHYLYAIRRVRWTVMDRILRSDIISIDDVRAAAFIRDDFLHYHAENGKDVLYEDPWLEEHANDGRVISPLHREALRLWDCFDALERQDQDGEGLAYGLYLNFLGHRLITLLTVQQINQTGFDQFQKFTESGGRSNIEREYELRFLQLGVTESGDHDHLEGRFAPKDTVEKLADLITGILKGYYKYSKCPHSLSGSNLSLGEDASPCMRGVECSCNQDKRRRMRLGLVCHFIKLEEHKKCLTYENAFPVRYSALLAELDRKGRALIQFLRMSPVARNFITGIDAANNELFAPPSVFAPLYRMARRFRIPHASYHVGEDYRHLVSGIRAIYEAVCFLELQNGDRIGHGTAIGIDPSFWRDRMEPRLLLPLQDALDDAVFAYQILITYPDHAAEALRLERKINEWQSRLYHESASVAVLIEAWHMRSLNAQLLDEPELLPYLALSPYSDKAEHEISRLKHRFLDDDKVEEICLLHQARCKSPAAFDIFRKYHSIDVRKRAQQWVEVEVGDYSISCLIALQHAVIRLLNDRNVAIESLPTSNVRISFYDHFRQHHIFRWLGIRPAQGVSGPEPLPVVCIGSDDTGIFCTNLRNEYMHLYQTMVQYMSLSHDEAMSHLRRLNNNGRIYRFQRNVPHSVQLFRN